MIGSGEALTLDGGDGLVLRELVRSEASTVIASVEKSEDRFRESDPTILETYGQLDVLVTGIRYQNRDFRMFGLWSAEAFAGIASLRLKKESVRKKSGDVAYWVDEDHVMQGIASRATRTIIDFGFQQPNVETIGTRVFTGNVASAATSQAAGLKYMGLMEDEYGRGDVWRFGAFKTVPKELATTFSDEVLHVETQRYAPHRSVEWIALDGVSKAIINYGSETKYYVKSGEVTLIVDGKPVVLRTDDELEVPRGSTCQSVGRATMYAVCTPGFDPRQIETVRPSTTPPVSGSV